MSIDIEARQARLEKANELLVVIATHGRRFFHHNGTTARLELDERGRVWFIDHYSKRRIYTHRPWLRRGFSSGGTMNALIRALRDFIMGRGTAGLRGAFGPWPEWVCGGDLWGYGDDSERVRTAAFTLLGMEAVQ